MSTGLLIDGNYVQAPVPVHNFYNLDIPGFKSRGPRKLHRHIVLHENAGSINHASLYRWLNYKKYGYHLMVDPYGYTTQHVDLCDRVYHGGKANRTGIGIVTLNPYYPHLVNTDEEKSLYKLAPAQWWTHVLNGDRRYAQLTSMQLDVIEKLVPFICEQLDIPYTFPTRDLNKRKRKSRGWLLPRVLPKPGVIAHRDYSRHADGRYALEHLYQTAERNDRA